MTTSMQRRTNFPLRHRVIQDLGHGRQSVCWPYCVTLLLPCVISRAARWSRAWIQSQLSATLSRLRRPIRK